MILEARWVGRNQCELRVTCDECYGYKDILCTPQHDLVAELARWGWETRKLPYGEVRHYCDDCTITDAPAFGETK